MASGHELDVLTGNRKLTPRQKVKGIIVVTLLDNGRYAVLVDGYVRQVYYDKEDAVRLARALVESKPVAGVPHIYW